MIIKMPSTLPTSSEPNGKGLLTDQITQRIQNLIIERNLGEGDRLPTEAELTAMFGVSRIVVREAIKSLSFLGMLDTRPRRGTVVGTLDMERLGRCLSFHGAVSSYPRPTILEARIVLEVGHLDLAVKAMDGPMAGRLLELADKGLAEAGAGDTKGFADTDNAFHALLLETGGNPILMTFCDVLKKYFGHDMDKGCSRESMRIAAQEHRLIVEALQEGNLTLAKGMMQRHLGRPLQDRGGRSREGGGKG
jgi:GntR family transcriptional regulator, transcriptional repressor for pyruvate dehydrogenase complex